VQFGATRLGRIAIAPGGRGVSKEDHRVAELCASELGGPLRMASLVADAQRIASTDGLTALLNRRAFVERIQRLREATEADRFPMSMLLLDLDHFKEVNDTLGHEAGDAVLRSVAAVLSGMARKTDIVVRWGGEEFVIALVRTAEAGARVAAERVRRAIAEASHLLPDGSARRATASVGLASAEGSTWELEELINRADRAMYTAKHRGRNRVETG
jgi:diguanylate cyclase (GGDEF)-like protein